LQYFWWVLASAPTSASTREKEASISTAFCCCFVLLPLQPWNYQTQFNSVLGSSSKKKKNESMEFVQRGSNPKSKLFWHKIWGRSWAINIYFWIQTLGGREGSTKSLDKIHTFIFFFGWAPLVSIRLTLA
jgi:hypothetical protein